MKRVRQKFNYNTRIGTQFGTKSTKLYFKSSRNPHSFSHLTNMETENSLFQSDIQYNEVLRFKHLLIVLRELTSS